MTEDKAAPDWSPAAVNALLRKQAAGSSRASANVFFTDSVAADKLSEVAKEAIGTAAAHMGKPASVEIGRVHRLAKSVSVKGDPDIIAELWKSDNVKTILPSEIDDILPKPVKKKIVK